MFVVAVLWAAHVFGHALAVVGAVADAAGIAETVDAAGAARHAGTDGRLAGELFVHGSCHDE